MPRGEEQSGHLDIVFFIFFLSLSLYSVNTLETVICVSCCVSWSLVNFGYPIQYVLQSGSHVE